MMMGRADGDAKCNREWVYDKGVNHYSKGKGTRPRIMQQYLDKADKASTSNMHKHAKTCWGGEIVSQAPETKKDLTINEVRESLAKAKVQDGTITAMFERKGKGSVMFSTKQHTYTETRSVDIILV